MSLSNLLKMRYVLLLFLLFLVTFFFLFFRYGGEVLVVEDDLEEVDEAVSVLLMGSVGDRALGAIELYENGKVDQIVMVRSHLAGHELLEENNISIPGDAELSKKVLTDSGVPEDKITIIPGDAESTKDEALAIRKYLQNHPEIDQLILTTSKFHSYRSKLIFNKALKDENITIYAAPTPYDPYEATGWYRDREDIWRVATEYMKLAHYFFMEQFQMN
ncbi:YdcF family protein [Oceanobacillus alkalisoli]|uniref:YdcF family protein n=1 Tax=Oceanobacillus alkalisoli TaxID=2925113 RepID=UPI001EF0030B|nr:YdcF family protein [Oceanobacillus alkalisoli]MCF3945011.1 YdcF family protein [Oceanobacillus alkalisoli]MCG5102181.1 YdcF family protein [Oceanobacillus alkalisoli]